MKIVGFIFDAIERTEKCSRKKNIKSFLTRGSLRMQALKLATTADISRVSVQGVKSHFACLCQGFDFYEVKKILIFSKKKEILLHF